LRAQAQDVREMSRRRLIETGGKKEIAMMIPVVMRK
jgi:tight adherence protein C